MENQSIDVSIIGNDIYINVYVNFVGDAVNIIHPDTQV